MLGLFKKKVSTQSLANTDIHSHLIPGIDDGCQTMEESISTIKSLIEIGYSNFITTPHVISDSFKNTPEIIQKGLEELRIAVQNEGLNIKIEAAAEYYVDEWFYDAVQNNADLLTFAGNHILVETSYINKPHFLHQVIFGLNSSGKKTIIAHPERYAYLNSENEFTELKEKGVYFQINLNSLAGYYGIDAKKKAQMLIKNEMVDFIGSDCHGPRHVGHLIKAINTKEFKQLSELNILNNTLAI